MSFKIPHKVFLKTILIFKAFAGKDIPMPSILLVAETGSDISPELAAQYNIHIVPMHVAFGTDPVDDGSFPAEEIRDLTTIGIKKLTAGTAINNIPSVSLLKSLGFKLIGTEKVSFYKDEHGSDIFFEGGIFELNINF